MSWFNNMLTSLAQQNMNASEAKASGVLETIGTAVGGIGGALTGAAIGTIFGPAGAAIGMYAGAYIGSEGAQACVRTVKGFLGSP